MSLKKLRDFLYFDVDLFFEAKELRITGIKDWIDKETKKVLGTRAEIAIVKDDTDYGDAGKTSNKYEKFYVKVPVKLNLPLDTIVTLKNPEANVWGEYSNILDVTAENIIPKQTTK